MELNLNTVFNFGILTFMSTQRSIYDFIFKEEALPLSVFLFQHLNTCAGLKLSHIWCLDVI
jgi:hypothetical protein